MATVCLLRGIGNAIRAGVSAVCNIRRSFWKRRLSYLRRQTPTYIVQCNIYDTELGLGEPDLFFALKVPSGTPMRRQRNICSIARCARPKICGSIFGAGYPPIQPIHGTNRFVQQRSRRLDRPCRQSRPNLRIQRIAPTMTTMRPAITPSSVMAARKSSELCGVHFAG
jgi:hypothetical protein